MLHNKQFFEKVFSTKCIEHYFLRYPNNVQRAVLHYQCNLQLAKSVCWNLHRVEEIHKEMITVMGWMNKDVPGWLSQVDRFNAVCCQIRNTMNWT